MKRAKRMAPKDDEHEQGDLLDAERRPRAGAEIVHLDPDQMMQLAIRQGGEGKLTDVAEVIERLTRLKVEQQEREDKKELSRALAAARRAFPKIAKNRENVVTSTKGNYGFTWADLPAIAAAVDPVLEEHGLSYSWVSEMANGAAQLIVRCILRHENGQSITSDFPVPTASGAGMSDQQRFASAQMFGRRKSLEQVLGLVIEDMPHQAALDMDPTKVTPDQAQTIADLCGEVGGDKAKFLSIYNVKEWGDLPRIVYPAAVALLEARRKK